MCPNFWKNQRYGHDPGANVPEVREKSRETVTIRGRKCRKVGGKAGEGHNRGKKVPKVLEKTEERSQSEEESARS